MNICPVCGYDELQEPPYVGNDPATGSFEICCCCGYQYGVEDLDLGITHDAYRDKWLADGAPWFSKSKIKPLNWDLKKQLSNIGIQTRAE